MARPRKKQKQQQFRKHCVPASGTQDITLDDYANATKPAGRPKKHNTITMSPARGEGAAYAEGPALTGRRRRRRRDDAPPDTGREYPEILFYLLSHYILPEDVGRFAGINRAAYTITKCEGFWRGLFARHCERAARGLPARLDLARAPRLYGLRQRVVCALHRVYQPFLLERTGGSGESPSSLVGRRCVDIWYVKGVDSWLYYVKLKRAGAGERSRTPAGGRSGGRGDDIDANPERDSCVMLVKCAELEQVPPAMGLLLSSATSSLAAGGGYRLRRLQLGFVCALHLPRPAAAAAPPDLVCVLNTVQEMSVVQWWERHYPAFACAPPRPAPRDEPLLRTEFALADLE